MKAAELRQSLTIEDIVRLVTKGLGSNDCLYDSDGNPIFQTICHNEEGCGKYKLYYYASSQKFHCYTQCGDSFDVYELVQRAGKANDFIGAYHYLLDFFNIERWNFDIDKEEPQLTADWDLLNKYAIVEESAEQEEKIVENTSEINPGLLKYFNPLLPLKWAQEGIAPEAMEKYHICMDLSMQKIVIPHYDKDGALIGIRGRTYNWIELNDGKKYSPIYIENTMYNHPLGDHLYGLNWNAEAIQRTRKAVIFEGEKSVLKAETYYGENNFTVAACGSAVSDKQVQLLLSLGVNEIIIAFDKENDDSPGSERSVAYKAKLERIASQFAPYVNTYYIFDRFGLLGPKDSPIDRGRDTLEFLLKNKVLVPSFTVMKEKRGK